MKKTLQIITIGSIFLFCGASFFGILSVNNENIPSGFWNIRQIVITPTYADDDEDDDHHSRSRESSHDDERHGDDDRDSHDDDYYQPTPTPVTPTPTPVTPTPTTCTYQDANYTGTASYSESRVGGMANPVTVTTKIIGGKVSVISVSTQFTHANLTNVEDTIVADVIATQKVSTVSGASGIAIVSAIQDSISQANSCSTNIPAPVSTLTQNPTPTPTPKPVAPASNVFTGEGTYSYLGGSLTSIVELTVTNGKITAAQWKQFFPSGNGNYTRAMADANLQKLINSSITTVDTISGATGTSNAVQDAINNALAKARNASTGTSSTPAPTPSQNSTLSVNNTPTKYTAPNGKAYIIHLLTTGAYIFERPDGSISSKKFTTSNSAIAYIAQNNPEVIEEGIYTAPNGKTYKIIHDTTLNVYMFKRADGTMSSREFSTKDAMISYIHDNNPIIVAPVVAQIKITPAPIKRTTSTVAPRTATTAAKAAAATPAPKVNTTTTVS